MGEETLWMRFGHLRTGFAGSKCRCSGTGLFILELATELSRFGANNQINLEDVFGRQKGCIHAPFRQNRRRNSWDWLLFGLSEITKTYPEGTCQDTTKSFVSKAIDYVKDLICG